jgi:hypothetical protein
MWVECISGAHYRIKSTKNTKKEQKTYNYSTTFFTKNKMMHLCNAQVILCLIVFCGLFDDSFEKDSVRRVRGSFEKDSVRGSLEKDDLWFDTPRLLAPKPEKPKKREAPKKGKPKSSKSDDQPVGEVSLELVGILNDGFNPVDTPVCFSISSSMFASAAFTVEDSSLDPLIGSLFPLITIDGEVTRLDSASILSMSSTEICTIFLLHEGLNELTIEAKEWTGQMVYLERSVWAGSKTIQVDLQAQSSEKYSGTVLVIATLVDFASMRAQKETDTGQVVFENVPSDKMVLFEALGPNNAFGSTSSINAQSVSIILRDFADTPSPVQNLDFAIGTEGWTTTTETGLQTIAHIEDAGKGNEVVWTRRELVDDEDQDLMLVTNGVGEQLATHSFTVNAGTLSVSVRYRFQTNEFPDWYGSEYNDYYSISLRADGGTPVHETLSMNVIGKDSFDSTGSTGWRELVTFLDPQKPVTLLQIEMVVANVGDGDVDSSLIIDKIKPHKVDDICNLSSGSLLPIQDPKGYSTISSRKECFRDYNGILRTLEYLKQAFPDLVTVQELGSTYKALYPGNTELEGKKLVENGDQIRVMILTNNKTPFVEGKGKLLLLAGIHAR